MIILETFKHSLLSNGLVVSDKNKLKTFPYKGHTNTEAWCMWGHGFVRLPQPLIAKHVGTAKFEHGSRLCQE